MTLANALSGCLSNGAPHVAPALAKRISTWSVCLLTSATSLSTSLDFARSAGTEIALPLKPGSLFSASHASSHAFALRDVIKILEQPACASLHLVNRWRKGTCKYSAYPAAECRPRPREPPVMTATLSFRLKMLPKFSSWTSASADIVRLQ